MFSANNGNNTNLRKPQDYMNFYDDSQNDLKENQISISSINFKSKSTNSATNLHNNKLLPTPV